MRYIVLSLLLFVSANVFAQDDELGYTETYSHKQAKLFKKSHFSLQVMSADSVFDDKTDEFYGYSVRFNDGLEYIYETKSLSTFVDESYKYLDYVHNTVFARYMYKYFINEITLSRK